MIIALDFDGTIADANRLKAAWIKENLDIEIPSWQCSYTECVPIVGPEVHKPMGQIVYGREGTLRAEEVSGALDALRILSRDHTLHIVTARPDSRVPFAREWLEQNGVIDCITSMHSSVGSTKASICSALGARVLVDDDVRHLTESENPDLTRILLQDGRTDRPDYGPDVVFCTRWDEILKQIQDPA